MLIAALAIYGNIHIFKMKKGIKCSKLCSYIEACSIWMLFLFAVTEAISVTAYHYDIYAHRGADNRPYGYFIMRWDETTYYAQITDEIKGKGYQSVGLNRLFMRMLILRRTVSFGLERSLRIL